jgi:hypothetical protein
METTFAPVPAPPPRPSTARVIAGLASLGRSAWDLASGTVPAHVTRPQTACVRSGRSAAHTSQLSANAVVVTPRAPPTPRSVPPPTGTGPAEFLATLQPRRPLTAGSRVSNSTRELIDEMHIAGASAAALRESNPAVGPLAYRSEKAWESTQPNSPRAAFSSAPRLSILPLNLPAPSNGADGSKRVKTSRCAHQPGRGHWLDGMATGGTIVGCYSRFLTVNPGVATYDVVKASENIRLRIPHATFGTASRFPGGPKVKAPEQPVARTPRANAALSKPPVSPR